MDKTLAIIIPAYKSRFLHQALDSAARQTCGDFKVYVGDDKSILLIAERWASRSVYPSPLQAICNVLKTVFVMMFRTVTVMLSSTE